MDDGKVLARITALVDEERALRARDDEGLDAMERKRMSELEVELDQCWDYLRQRRAAREFGLSPEQASVRPPKTVERYRQ